MLKRAIIAVAVLALAAPGLAAAKGKRAADESTAAGPAAPVPYSQLAEEDAKLNGPAPKAHHHHMMKKKVSKDASQAGSAEVGKTAK